MAKEKFPGTQAIRALKKHAVNYALHPYRYEEKGGTEVAAEALNVEEHQVIKTLVMEDDKKELKVYIESTIMDLPRIYINAGRKGLLVEMSPKDLIKILDPTPVNVAV